MLQYVAVCCSVVQCVVLCCSVAQYVAVCCSVVQCVAEESRVEVDRMFGLSGVILGYLGLTKHHVELPHTATTPFSTL